MRYILGGAILYASFISLLWYVVRQTKRRERHSFFLQWNDDAKRRHGVKK